jgi:hypothetical protein
MPDHDKIFLISHDDRPDTRQINDTSSFVSNGFPFYSNIPIRSRIIPHSLSRPYTEHPDYDLGKKYIVMYEFTYFNIMPIEVRNAMMNYYTYHGYYPMQVDHVQTIFDYLVANNVVGKERVRVEVENHLIEVPHERFGLLATLRDPFLTGEISRALSISATKNLNIAAYGEESTDVIMRHFREIGSEGLIRITYQPSDHRPSRSARNRSRRSRRSHAFNTLGRRSTGRHLRTSRRRQQLEHEIANLTQSTYADDRNLEWSSGTVSNAFNGLR